MNAIILNEDHYIALISKIEELSEKLNDKQLDIKMQYLTNKSLAEILDISTRTLQNWRDQGLITFIQIGSKIYYRQEDVEVFMKSHLKRALD